MQLQRVYNKFVNQKEKTMDDDKLSEIMMEFSYIGAYIEILRDFCEYKNNSREMSLIIPFLEHICNKYKVAYNALDDFERQL